MVASSQTVKTAGTK